MEGNPYLKFGGEIVMNIKEKVKNFFYKYLFEKYLKDKEMWWNLMVLSTGLVISCIAGFLTNRYKLKEKIGLEYPLILIIQSITFLCLVVYFLKQKFNTDKDFENKCKGFGCEFLIFYSKNKNLEHKYDKLLPILESWKLGYYGTLVPVYIGVASLLILNNELKNKLKEDAYYYFIYIIVVLSWMLGRSFIHKILLIEKMMEYKTKFSDEIIPYLSEIVFAIMITFLGMLNMFKAGEEFGLMLLRKV